MDNRRQPFTVEETRARIHRDMHRGLIASLLIVIFLFGIARHLEIKTGPEWGEVDGTINLLALEAIMMKKKPPPPPKPKFIPPVVVQPPPDAVPMVTRPKRRERPDRWRRSNPAKLDLRADDSPLFASTAGLGGLADPNARAGRRALDMAAPQLNSRSLDAAQNFQAGPSSLDLDTRTTTAPHTVAKPGIELNLHTGEDEKPEPEPVPAQARDEISDFLNVDVSLVLASTDLSMGVEEYSVWNRINAEFDRWDKGRYGRLPRALRRRGRAIIAAFDYTDGTAYRIVWLRGNTKIYIHGNADRSRLQELEQALTSIIHLNTKRSGY